MAGVWGPAQTTHQDAVVPRFLDVLVDGAQQRRASGRLVVEDLADHHVGDPVGIHGRGRSDGGEPVDGVITYLMTRPLKIFDFPLGLATWSVPSRIRQVLVSPNESHGQSESRYSRCRVSSNRPPSCLVPTNAPTPCLNFR